VSVAEEPAHSVTVAGEMVSDGVANTVSDTAACAVQPLAPVPVTVYTMLDVGEAVSVALLIAVRSSPVVGDHVYVTAPPAVSVRVCPLQSVALVGLTERLGAGNTLTVPVICEEQPPVVPVTV